VRLHVWTENVAPVLTEYENCILFYDYPGMWNFQPGDEIKLWKDGNDLNYIVTDVQPANLEDYAPELNIVTAEEKQS
jgi:hypothetical protein